MRGFNGERRGVNNALETISAAATVIASAENRVPQATIQKKKWGSWWSMFSCFGSHRDNKRIGHAFLSSETPTSQADISAAQNPVQTHVSVMPFIAPPSSPASFFQSEPPSATQSPAGVLSFTSISANIYSPGGPNSIFAIGPYAHETQLVSPPVFSTFTTEPSTAPFTPPPESVHLTTPSSPEVPFAHLLGPNDGRLNQTYSIVQYEFPSYQLYPGSPVGHLISPSSAISGSGTSSPFPDRETISGGTRFLDFWQQGSGSLTPDAVRPISLDHRSFQAPSRSNSDNGRCKTGDTLVAHRVSFELIAQAVRCLEKKPTALVEAVSGSLLNVAMVKREGENCSNETDGNIDVTDGSSNKTVDRELHDRETFNELADEAPPTDAEEWGRHQKHRSITLGSVKEFDFDSADGDDTNNKPNSSNIQSDWWANEKVVGKNSDSCNKWAFFPVMQPGVS